MKFSSFLAVVALLGDANASSSGCTMAQVKACHKKLDEIKFYRWLVRDTNQMKGLFNEWYDKKRSDTAALAEVESTPFDPNDTCQPALDHCNHQTRQCRLYTMSLEDPNSNMNRWLDAYKRHFDKNPKYWDYYRARGPRFLQSYPIEDNDGDKHNILQAERQREEAHNQAAQAEQPSNYNNIPTVSASQKPNTCDGAVQRTLAQGQGRLAAQGQTFLDTTFGVDSMNTVGGPASLTVSSPVDFMAESPLLWGQIKPNNIIQGSLSDCWLLATLAALAENPERVRKIFLNQGGYTDNGQFVLQMYLLGQPQFVTIDDQLAGIQSSYGFNLRYTRMREEDGNFWVNLAEKAYAKFVGDVQSLKYGNTVEAFSTLTNMPVKQIRHNDDPTSDSYDQDKDILWNLISEWEQKNYPITGAISISEADQELIGLVNAHAYTILGVATDGANRLLRMRNPWGTETYTGPYSDDSSFWTQAKQEEYKHSLANDGEFFMPFDLYYTHSSKTEVAYYDETWKKARLEVTWDRQSNTLGMSQTFVNPVPQEVAVCIKGYSSRMLSDENCDSQYKTEKMAIGVYIDGKEEADSTQQQNAWMFTKNAVACQIYTNMPAGTHQVKIRNNAANNISSPMKYAFTFDSKVQPIQV